VPRSVTPESLRAEADALDAEIERLREEATDLRRLADRMEQRATRSSSDLTSNADSTILQDVIANSSGKLARGISRSRSKKHPFVRALYENPDPKKRMTVTDWAKKNGFKPGTAATWVKPPKSDGARRIPREAVEKIREQFGLGDDAWTVGITEPE
jgi:hypothetical protein